jgi:hydroxymethylpyrimidine kinase/phosphomethylpyrimidine kinase/thiamine-phosphate diphosphorylase
VESALYHSKDLVIGNGPQGPFDRLFELKSQLYKMGSLQKFNPDDLFLYAVTDAGMNKWGRSIKDAVKAAIEGGATIVQSRLSFLKTTKVPLAIQSLRLISLTGL